MTPKGIRLNNPGNIERNNTKWQGLSPDQIDKRFCSFTSPIYGLRAIFKILITYKSRGKYNVRDVINTWAPSHENPTNAYIDFVCNHSKHNPDEPIRDYIKVTQAIVRFENGPAPKGEWYPDSFYEQAYKLAKGK